MNRQRGSLLIYAVCGVVILAAVAALGRAVYVAGSNGKQIEWDAANEKQRKDEAKKAAAAGEKKEKGDAKAKVVYRTITQTVDKYIDRPVYRNVCFDTDGMRDANAALDGALTPAGKPDKPLSKVVTAYRWEWSLRVAQNN